MLALRRVIESSIEPGDAKARMQAYAHAIYDVFTIIKCRDDAPSLSSSSLPPLSGDIMNVHGRRPELGPWEHTPEC